MATIRKNRRKFQAIIRKKGFPGQSKCFTHRADAVAWASIIESEMERGEFTDRSEADRSLFKDLLEKYSKEVTPRKKGAAQELTRIRYWKRHRLGKCAVSKLRPSDFGSWRDAEIKAGKAASTVRNGLILVSHFFNHCRKEWGLPVKNPISDIWMPKLPPGRDRRYRDGEEFRLMEAAARVDAFLAKAIIVLTETGMRRGELTGMVKDRLDIKRRVHRIPDTKNSQPREVPLSPRAIETLSSLPTFIDGKVWPWSADVLTRLFSDAREIAGINDFHLHDLRHEAISRLARIYPIHELARITGHKTLNQLMRYYHPTADELAERLARA